MLKPSHILHPPLFFVLIELCASSTILIILYSTKWDFLYLYVKVCHSKLVITWGDLVRSCFFYLLASAWCRALYMHGLEWVVRACLWDMWIYLCFFFIASLFFWIHVLSCRLITLLCTMMRRKMWSQAWNKRPCMDGPTGIMSSRQLQVNTQSKESPTFVFLRLWSA